MSTAQDTIESTVIELSEKALNAFADDIATMFEVEMDCEQADVGLRTTADILKRFKKLSTFHTVQAKGALEGAFSVGFDCGGLFTLGGVIVMLPPNRVKESVREGTLGDAEAMQDAVGEVGNLLIGAWDRVFREELGGHKHFRKENTFIGNLADNTESALGLAPSEEFHYIEYKMTLGEFKPFTCGVIYPVAMFSNVAGESEPAVPEPQEAPAPVATAEPEPNPEPEPSPPVAEDSVSEPEPVTERIPYLMWI